MSRLKILSRSHLDLIDKSQEIFSDNIIVNKEFKCESQIVDNTDDSNGNRNDDSHRNITLSDCFRPININEMFTIETTSNTSTKKATETWIPK